MFVEKKISWNVLLPLALKWPIFRAAVYLWKQMFFCLQKHLTIHLSIPSGRFSRPFTSYLFINANLIFLTASLGDICTNPDTIIRLEQTVFQLPLFNSKKQLFLKKFGEIIFDLWDKKQKWYTKNWNMFWTWNLRLNGLKIGIKALAV